MKHDEIKSFYPTSRHEWRKWLIKNHDKKKAVWLICYKKETGKPTITWSDAVDEALCFGWIDSVRKSIDKEKFMQFFSRRKPKSMWSRINKLKVERLVKEGLMTKAGFDAIEIAKENGSWSIMDEVDDLIIPKDLEEAFKKRPGSKGYFMEMSKSDKRFFLQWLVMAKRPETRLKRIHEIVKLSSKK